MSVDEIAFRLDETTCRRLSDLPIIEVLIELNKLGISHPAEVRLAMQHIWALIE